MGRGPLHEDFPVLDLQDLYLPKALPQALTSSSDPLEDGRLCVLVVHTQVVTVLLVPRSQRARSPSSTLWISLSSMSVFASMQHLPSRRVVGQELSGLVQCGTLEVGPSSFFDPSVSWSSVPRGSMLTHVMLTWPTATLVLVDMDGSVCSRKLGIAGSSIVAEPSWISSSRLAIRLSPVNFSHGRRAVSKVSIAGLHGRSCVARSSVMPDSLAWGSSSRLRVGSHSPSSNADKHVLWCSLVIWQAKWL